VLAGQALPRSHPLGGVQEVAHPSEEGVEAEAVYVLLPARVDCQGAGDLRPALPADEEVEVDQWNGEELLARLNRSPEGERVARTFFEDPELDKERLYQAIRAKDVLDTAEDALDRMRPVGAFLRGHDAYFSYPGGDARDRTAGAAPYAWDRDETV